MDLATGTVVDRYTVHSVIGEGGMAMVYLCKHNQLGTDHALKVLTMSSRAIRERLVQEGRVQASLRHPNVVAVTDILAINGAPGLLMEFISGPSLDDLIDQQSLTYEQVDHLMRGVMEGVAYAHEQGLVHRDLKPANVMLEVVAGSLVPKVTDFGLAKLIEGDQGRAATRTGSTMGTPHYMSPEQVADSKNVDHRTDVFALGAIMYELVTGKRAFGGENLLQIFAAAAAGEFIAPRTLRADIPARMENAILGALEPDRDVRIQTVADLLAVWEGRALATGVVPSEPAGPFDAAFMNSVQSIHSSFDDAAGIPTPTWSGESAMGAVEVPISVETLAQGPPVQSEPVPVVSGAVAASQVSGVPTTSLVRGTTMVLGGGAAFMAGAVGLVALLAVVVGLYWFLNRADITIEPPDHVAVVDAEPEPTPMPGGEPEPEPAAPEPAAPEPTAPEPAAPVAPTPVPVEPDAVVVVDDPEPEEPEPAEEPLDSDEPELPVEPEPLEPEPVVVVEEPEPSAIPPNSAIAVLDDPKPSKRMKAIDALVAEPSVSAKLVDMARNDTNLDVRIKAWQTIGGRYRAKTGDMAVQEALIVEALGSGVFSRREAANHYGFAGSSVAPLEPALSENFLTAKSGVAAISRIVERHPDQSGAARAMLEARVESAGGPLRGSINNALAALP